MSSPGLHSMVRSGSQLAAPSSHRAGSLCIVVLTSFASRRVKSARSEICLCARFIVLRRRHLIIVLCGQERERVYFQTQGWKCYTKVCNGGANWVRAVEWALARTHLRPDWLCTAGLSVSRLRSQWSTQSTSNACPRTIHVYGFLIVEVGARDALAKNTCAPHAALLAALPHRDGRLVHVAPFLTKNKANALDISA